METLETALIEANPDAVAQIKNWVMMACHLEVYPHFQEDIQPSQEHC